MGINICFDNAALDDPQAMQHAGRELLSLALIDARERQIKLWRQGALLAEADFAGLGLIDPRGLSIAQQTLYVADGNGRRVLSFRLRT